MDAVTALRRSKGIARTRTLHTLGVSRHHLARAMERGLVIRPRKGWVALPGTDPALLDAARMGAVLTCVTQAARLGLWDVGAPLPHVAVTPGHHLFRVSAVHAHWSLPVTPREPDAVEDPIENVLILSADCQPHENALAIWESALRQARVDRHTLEQLPLSARARRILGEADPFADAGTESIVSTRLRWLRLPIRRQVMILGHRVDLLIGERLVIQIDGGHHVDRQRLIDNEHDARLRLAGYHVIRVGYRQVMDDWATVQQLITSAIARGLHVRRTP